MTRPLPSLSEFPMPTFHDGDWSNIEEILGARLNNKARAEVEGAAQNYVVAKFLDSQEAYNLDARGRSKLDGSAKVSTPLWRLAHEMDQLLNKWRDAVRNQDVDDLLTDYDKICPDSHRNLQSMMGDLQYHRIALRLYLGRGKRGAPEPRLSPFSALVGRLASIYRDATGENPTKTSRAVIPEGAEPGTPFVRFVQEIDQIAPKPARRAGADTPTAWAQAVRRALKEYCEYKARGNLPQEY